MTEQQMVVSAARRLRRSGATVGLGIPFMSRCIDLVLIESGDQIRAVEFKLHDWRRAVAQAKDHLLGADVAYICLPVKEPTRALLEVLEESGVGLMRYVSKGGQPFEEVVPARPSQFIWPPARRWLVESVEQVGTEAT